MAQATQPLYTCLSCSIAFLSPEEQRDHYKSDYHRYNMKRRVAGLLPVAATVFNKKVLHREEETAVVSSPRGEVCEVCNKTYTTGNSYRSHIRSRKHKDNEVRAALKSKSSSESTKQVGTTSSPKAKSQYGLDLIEKKVALLVVGQAATEEDINRTIDDRITAARSHFSPFHCLFCSEQSSSLESNLTHMSIAHSFFIPDADYLVDTTGLIAYLSDKIAIGNVCIYCGDKGRQFRTSDAVRKHMIDKSHCKIAYDNEDERLEISDYYDFTASYPDAHVRRRKALEATDEEWEDMDEDEISSGDELGEIIDKDASESVLEDSVDLLEDPEDQITYGDSRFELVLPSGARIGHRSLKRYYAQSFSSMPRGGKPEDPNSGAALVRRLLGEKNSDLVPRKGGFGAYGAGTDVIKARNRGEAREAGRHVREFRDQRRREDFKTKVGFIHNHQKHFRDPLLQ